MCLACGMGDEDYELWAAYQDYLEQRGLAGFELTPVDPGASPTVETPAREPRQPPQTTFTCDET